MPPLRPARGRRRDRGSRHRRGGDGTRAHGRARRALRLRRGDVLGAVEADPRRAALPADGRRPPRARGASGASRADERRRAPSRAPAAVRIPALRARAAPPARRAHRRAAVFRARAGAAERPRQRVARASARAAAPHRRPALVRALRRRLDERRAPDSGKHPRGRRPRRRRPELRRGGRDRPRGRRRGRGRRVGTRPSGGDRQIQRASTFTPTGPWLHRVRRLEDEQATPSIRLSKGVHVIADGGDGWGAAVTIPHDKVRVSFAIPWEGKLLLGTTDTLHEGEPEDAQATDDDVRTILAEASVAVREIGTVRTTFCGLRVLPGGPGETANARRETVYTRGRLGMLSVAGGKLTTYRRIALDALDQLGVRNVDRRPRQLPRAAGLSRVRCPLELEPATRTHLLHLYGSLAREVVAPAVEDPSLLEPLVAGRPDLRAQALYAREREWARTDEDVLRRRTTAWLAGLDSNHGSEAHTADPAAGS